MRSFLLFLALIATFHQDVNSKTLSTGECCEDYCYSTDAIRPQRKHFTSRSAYQLIKGTQYKEESSIPNCTPVKFWMLSRHGTRLPGEWNISKLPKLMTLRNKIIKNYETKKSIPAAGSLCSEDLELIKNWVLDANITEDHDQYLTVQGWNDLKLLAKDYQSVYPKLLPSEYKDTDFLFRHTDTQRTKASYQAFVEGLFGADAYQNIKLSEIPVKDTLLGPYDNCPLWNDQDEHKNDPGTEVYNFKHSDLMNQTISDVSSRLGFDSPLKYKKVRLIRDMCRYETAWFLDKPSAWCAALTFEQVKVLEYYEDLKHQYKSGHVGNLNQNVACEVVQDMLKRLSTDDGPRATAYFSHSTLIQLFAVALGAMKDNPLLKSTNYEAMASRKWRTSQLDPFAANFAVIKYDCSSNTEDPSPKVKFFLNQSPLQLDWCNNGLCDLSDLMTHYKTYLNADCSKNFCTVCSL